jgi:hypothetical protein
MTTKLKKLADGSEAEMDEDTGLCSRVRVPLVLMDSDDKPAPVRDHGRKDARELAYERMKETVSNTWREPHGVMGGSQRAEQSEQPAPASKPIVEGQMRYTAEGQPVQVISPFVPSHPEAHAAYVERTKNAWRRS